MAILNIQIGEVGLVGVTPRVVYINTNNTLAEVTATGFLNQAVQQGFSFTESDMALVSTKTTPSSTVTEVAWLEVSYSSGNWSLVAANTPGEVVLPTTANYLAHFTNTTGTLSSAAANVTNPGNIAAGLSGTAGYLATFPATAARGSLRLVGANSAGDTVTQITNASMAAARVFTIPDGGQAASSFLITDSAGTQTIATGSLALTLGNLTVAAGNIAATLGSVSAGATVTGGTGLIATTGNIVATAGAIVSGAVAGGAAGSFIGYSNTASMGSLRLLTVDNGGNFAVTISNASHAQASVISIPDGGVASSNFIISNSAGGQTIATGGLTVTQGDITSGSSGNAGTFISFPATAANGTLILAAADAGAAFNTTISNGTMAQSTVYTIPDVAAATGQFLAKTAAFVNGNLIQASGTAGVCVDSGIATADVQLSGNIIAQQSADIGGAGAGPINIVDASVTAASVIVASIVSSTNTVAVAKVAPGAGSFNVTFTADPGAACVISYVIFVAAQ